MRCESWSEKWLTGVFVWGATCARDCVRANSLETVADFVRTSIDEIDTFMNAIAGD
jgi:hypothetical protein